MSDELRDDEYTPSMKRIRLEYMAMSEDSGGDPDLPLLGMKFDRALEVEIARRVAEAKAEVERLEIWKQVATILLEKVKVNGKPALEIFDTGLAVQQKGESNE